MHSYYTLIASLLPIDKKPSPALNKSTPQAMIKHLAEAASAFLFTVYSCIGCKLQGFSGSGLQG